MKSLSSLGAVWLLLVTAAPAQSAGVPAARLAHLRHGINIGRFAAQENPQCCAGDREAGILRAVGIDHVRLTVEPGFLFNFKRPDLLAGDRLPLLDQEMATLVKNGIPVVLVIGLDEDTFQNRLDRGTDFVERFADFWRALAQRYASMFSPDSVFFEVLNEPAVSDPYRWYGIQARIAAAIREGAPRNTIIATGAAGSHADALLDLEPLRDPNVVYTFHYYEPYVFTHQGADWAANYWHYLGDVRYPSSPDSARQAAERIPTIHAADRLYLVREMELYNGAGIQADIDQIADWAKRQEVPVICGEFGVEAKAPAADRAAWARDVRTSLENDSIGWTFWDYTSETFAVNNDILAALGLKPALPPASAKPGR